MATRAPQLSFGRLFFEPLPPVPLAAASIIVWLSGAAYCHGYQALLGREDIGPWSGSLTWSAVAVLPWFALFEWSKQPQGAEAARRPTLLIALIAGIATVSIGLEYFVNFCLGSMTDHLGLLVMRRLPAVGVTVLLIALTRKAMLRRPASPSARELSVLAPSIDWIEAADNYVEVHVGERVMLMRMTLAAAEEKLSSRGFARIHRRYLVNRNRIDRIIGSNGDRRVRIAGRELPIGSRYGAGIRPSVTS